MVTISNEFLTATFNEIGGELKSLKDTNGREYIWISDPAFWPNSAPVLFPICSNLKNNQYIYEGKTYQMNKHGFTRKAPFEVENVSKGTATFLLSSDNFKTDNYPFEYELRIVYTLIGKKMQVEYKVNNLTDGDMYFSIGSHEAYYCPELINDYEIHFSQPETLKNCIFKEGLISDDVEVITENSDVFKLDYSYFENDGCLVFRDVKSREVVLKNKSGDRKIDIKFDGCDYLLFWTVPNAPYICIEPWCGITDRLDTNQNLTEKEGIEHLKKGESFYRVHSFEIV